MSLRRGEGQELLTGPEVVNNQNLVSHPYAEEAGQGYKPGRSVH